MNEQITTPCDILLVQMPYTELDWPSIALSLLKAELTRSGLDAKVVYSSHRFAKQLGYDAFRQAEQSMQSIIMGWEILFAKYTGFEISLTIQDLLQTAQEELGEYLKACDKPDTSQKLMDGFLNRWTELDAQVRRFLNCEADYILSHHPRIVGCSIMTQQRNASFALLKMIKERAPEVTTILGGGICVGETARIFLDAAPQVDYVFTGEGDTIFSDGCRLLLEGKKEELQQRFPFFLSKGQMPETCVTPDLNQMAVPDYSDYFAQLSSEDFGSRLHPRLLLEGSRGCWWGEAGRCRFCGLHYSPESIVYREKSPETVWDEIWRQISLYHCRCISFTDCILSREFIRTLPELAAERQPFLFAECKSNLSGEEIRRLRAAGFAQLQPGIESIQDDLLELMHKGNRAIKHIELLKFMRFYGIRTSWNLLHSLPGDKPNWYEETLELMPLLHHLEPPSNVSSMILMRCSPYQEQAERFGLHTIVPQLFYYAMNPAEERFTQVTADLLASPDIRVDRDMVLRLNQGVNAWRNAFKSGVELTMTFITDEEGVHTEIRDLRDIRTAETFCLTGVVKEVYDIASSTVSLIRLHEELDERWGKDAVAHAICFLDENHLTAHIRGELLALALPTGILPWRKPPATLIP